MMNNKKQRVFGAEEHPNQVEARRLSRVIKANKKRLGEIPGRAGELLENMREVMEEMKDILDEWARLVERDEW